MLARPELASDRRFQDNPARVENRDVLVAELQAVFGGWTTSELVARLERGGIAFGRVRTVAELADHPQLELQDVDTPDGRVRMPAPATRWRESETDRRVPDLDEHGAALRKEFAP